MVELKRDRLQRAEDEKGRKDFLEDALCGLLKKNKQISSKYFYDFRGAQLFDRICKQDEYYLTRTEISIMRDHAPDIADRLGPECTIIEYGSGTSEKTGYLLHNLQNPAGYIPVDICEESLLDARDQLENNHPALKVEPICSDFTKPFPLPQIAARGRRKIVYFPGSTLGNFDNSSAKKILDNILAQCGSKGGLIIGLDLQKDRQVLESAYNDECGVTREFNLNLLRRMNNELDADFDLAHFEHRAIYDSAEGRIEMHLISKKDQVAHLKGHSIEFEKDECVLTEYSHKYDCDEFAELARSSGLRVEKIWTDPKEYFSVQYLTPENY